jgi:hypothetical protein
MIAPRIGHLFHPGIVRCRESLLTLQLIGDTAVDKVYAAGGIDPDRPVKVCGGTVKVTYAKMDEAATDVSGCVAQKRRFDRLAITSALPSATDLLEMRQRVRSVPTGDIACLVRYNRGHQLRRPE